MSFSTWFAKNVLHLDPEVIAAAQNKKDLAALTRLLPDAPDQINTAAKTAKGVIITKQEEISLAQTAIAQNMDTLSDAQTLGSPITLAPQDPPK